MVPILTELTVQWEKQFSIKYLFKQQYNKKTCIYQDLLVASNQSHLKNWNFRVYAIGKSETAYTWLQTFIFLMQQPSDIFKNKTGSDEFESGEVSQDQLLKTLTFSLD